MLLLANLFVALGLGLGGSDAQAGPVDIWGFGADRMGRAGGVALSDRPTGLFVNPAGLTQLEGAELTIGYALLRNQFRTIPDLHWDTNRDGRITDDDVPLSKQPDTRPADAAQFALGRPVGDRFAIGVAFQLPVNRLLRIHTFEPSLPHYVMLEDQPHRYELTAGFGWEQLPGVSVGGAIQLVAQGRFLVDTTITAPVGLAEDGDGQIGDLVGPLTLDLHEMTLDLSPALVPVVAINWELGPTLPALDGVVLAAAYRGSSGLPVDVDVDLQANLEAEDLGELGSIVVAALAPIELTLFDHYVPERWSLGGAWRGERLRVFGDLHYTRWDKLRLNIGTVTGGGLYSPVIELPDPEWVDGNPYTLQIDPTWTVGAGAEIDSKPMDAPDVGEIILTARGGVSYIPTPLVSQGADTSMLDADRVLVAVGLGVTHGDPFALVGGPIRWELFGQVQPVAQGTLQLPYPDPPRPGTPVGGAPIPIGGLLWATGGQWTVGF